ncbi:MAG: valine--tRNA ligase [Gemmataceae bacterium]|nr:valine--tRNA ligase [Gemmataceae bacterium]
MTQELAKQYDPALAKEECLRFWEEGGFFKADPGAPGEPFSIVIPPPNVTGALHLGHALNNTLQDILARWKRMKGFNVLWVPGTDHAGIATQAVVEKRVKEEEGKTRHDLGRDELVARIWKWKDQYEKRILGQLRELGASCDWSRTRFTLDSVCARAVRETFFAMFKKGFIYRGKRLVNWDTQLQTSVADDETFTETVKGGFWTFRYPVVGLDEFIRFSTTRPETMLGDTAVAVHPNDERYAHLVGKKVRIPICGREIPIIADAILVKKELGTGAVKVTPAHDRNDYACGLRHNLPSINILNSDGSIIAGNGDYSGLDRFEARKRVTADMEGLGFFEGREDRDIELSHSDRSKSPIEPFLSDQWFVRMEELAELAMQAVRDSSVRITPSRYADTYLDWLGEKRDWCISRQLWWGHRIPIWHVKCSREEVEQALQGKPGVYFHEANLPGNWLVCSLEDFPLGTKIGEGELKQDPDVLDTWFSSALWPHSTLGWPEATADLNRYYPTSVLVTSRDIITLWVARMVMTGLFNTGKVPFHQVYIHPKILDGFGETMSKSKGNGIDPLDIISRYGADALRYQMAHMATETQDSRMPVGNICPHCQALVPVRQEHMYMRTRKINCPGCKKPFRPGGPWPEADAELLTATQGSERFEQGRNFANKLWNATRFILMNLEGYSPGEVLPAQLPLEDQWLLSRLAQTAHHVNSLLESLRFSEAARVLYDFVWSEFCDWYLEMSKGRLKDQGRAVVQRVLIGAVDAILRLMHPIMPFLAETLWKSLNEAAPLRGMPVPQQAEKAVIVAAWPNFPAAWIQPEIDLRVSRMQELVRAVRDVRNRYMLDSRLPLQATVRCPETVAADLRSFTPFIQLLAGVDSLDCGQKVPRPTQSASHVHQDFEVFVSLAGLIDVQVEVSRLEKLRAEKDKLLQSIMAKLSNESFVSRAPSEIVQQQRDTVADLEKQLQSIRDGMESLGQGA